MIALLIVQQVFFLYLIGSDLFDWEWGKISEVVMLVITLAFAGVVTLYLSIIKLFEREAVINEDESKDARLDLCSPMKSCVDLETNKVVGEVNFKGKSSSKEETPERKPSRLKIDTDDDLVGFKFGEPPKTPKYIRDFVKEFPVIIYEPYKNFNVKTCGICISEYKPMDVLKVLPQCNHAFHSECIQEWYNQHTNCPFCRKEFHK